ncbi:hemolysin family protein [bacterium]|nr:hemolysin family protein [bacterium]
MIILYLIILLSLSAWFSGMEIALFSLSSAKIKALVKEKKKNSELLEKILIKKNKLLVVILLGNNLVNVFTASLTTIWIHEKFGSAAIGIATGAITFLILVFGEMWPKAYFQINAEKIALKFSPIIFGLQIILYPLIWILEKILNLLTNNKNEIISETEFKALSRMAVESGTIEFKEHEMIMNILDFNDKEAKEVMTSFYKVNCVSHDAEIDQVAYYMAHEEHSRYPVYKNHKDNILGYVHIKDIMKILNSDNREDTLEKYVKPLIRIDEHQKINSVFKKMIKDNSHIALVTRKKDQILGIITLEDILEEIVGEIEDEND